MKRGRPSKPVGIKLLQGTFRKDRDGAAAAREAAKPPTGPGQEPDWLKGEAKWAWRQLSKLLGPDGANILDRTDRHALILLCNTYLEYRTAHRHVEKYGQVYETSDQNGNRILRENPSVRIRDRAENKLNRWMTEFGLTPLARKNIPSGKEEARDPLEEILNRRNKKT